MNKNIFLIMAILSFGVFVIPSIYSIFSGEHNFYDTTNANSISISSTNGNATCLKCHSDITIELDSSAYHTGLSCQTCHINQNNPILNNNSHSNIIIPKCINCHNTTFDNDVHKPFVSGSNSDNNDACISCHTTKSIKFQNNLEDTYKFNALRGNDWQVSNYSKYMINSPSIIQYNGSGGAHTFIKLTDILCEKCHLSEKDSINNSNIHKTLSCNSCHQLNSGYHAASTSSCLDCHKYDNSTNNQADAHIPFVTSANTTTEKYNVACPLCHSNFNKDIVYTRPDYIEYDVENAAGDWIIANVALGQMKDVELTSLTENGNIHNTSLEDNCVLCHDDIRNAVLSGGHSNEQWKGTHNYSSYADMNLYCKSCHMPSTQQNGQQGQSPYPAYPFNSNVHGSMKISCTDCHIRSDLLININGNMVGAPYNDQIMGNIAISIEQQPYYLSSYLCIACKNVGSPRVNQSLHFKILTEPQTEVTVSGN